ncbi:MAG: class I SAM-dependent methyltransferase [Alphaproteobacteria bacterium]
MSAAHGSRLQAMIARLAAQRAHLDDAAARIAAVPGPVLEIGLGKGRTYDHLRRRLPDRRILVFDGSLHAPADLHPPAADLVLGDFRDTLPAAAGSLARAALIHADIGSDDRAADRRLASAIAPWLADLLAPAGLLLSDRPMPSPALVPADAPATAWPYYRYRLG